jgi:hypothetical protein
MAANAVSRRGTPPQPPELGGPKNRINKISALPLKQQVRKVPLLDLTRKHKQIARDLHRQWNVVFSSMQLLNGANLAAFEQEFAAYCGVKYALRVASGTDAIHLSLQALEISRSDEVILPAHAPAP